MRLDIDAPELQPIVHNLIATALQPDLEHGRWENGLAFVPDACFATEGFCYDCPPVELENFEGCPDAVEFLPYNASITVEVPSFDPAKSELRLRNALDVSTSSMLERMIWSGCGAEDTTTPTLADATDLAGSAATAAAALGSIIGAIADSSTHVAARGTIHVPATNAPSLYDHFDEVEGRLVTKVGHHVVVVGNYPAGEIAGHVGPIGAWVGDIEVAVAKDSQRSGNVFTARAWRPVLAVWNSCASFRQNLP